jgi:DNA-directed RNA polymerase specialized sigma24 family protein
MTRYATQGSFRSGRIVPGPWPPRQREGDPRPGEPAPAFSRTDGEDVSRCKVFLHLWERPWVFDPDRGRLRAWLATMAHHRSVDLLAGPGRRRGAAGLPAHRLESEGLDGE